jgi:hypothetical protein
MFLWNWAASESVVCIPDDTRVDVEQRLRDVEERKQKGSERSLCPALRCENPVANRLGYVTA